MKKRLWLTVFLACLIRFASAQNNYCDDLTRDSDVLKRTVTWRSPELNITLKSIMSDTTVQLWLNVNLKQQSEFIAEENGLFIRFDDGKSLKFFGQHIDRKYINARDGYFYQTELCLKPAEAFWFKTKKIIKYQIAGINVPVTDELATQIESYAICMSGMKAP